jgi:hypothetical protein
MASIPIDFTGGAPIRLVAGTTVQPIALALDLGGRFRVLDLTAQVTATGGASPITVSILTSSQNFIEVPQWPALGSFSNLTAADTAVRATFVGALRFVRYSIAVTGAGPAYVTINGFARTTE